MILHYVNQAETPCMNNMERLLVVVYLLGITTKRQLAIVTGWSEQKVEDTLARIRKQGKGAKEKDEWLRFWIPAPGQAYLYSLGAKGIEYAVTLRKEIMGRGKKKKQPHHRGHAGHFLGFNQLLCRLIEAGVEMDEFMVGKEVMSQLSYTLRDRRVDADGTMKAAQISYLPFRPDGLVTVKGETYYLEYDTGSETTIRLSERLERYLEANTNMGGQIPPVVWVTISQNRKGTIIRCAKRIQERFQEGWKQPVYPEMYCFVEGEEVAFFKGLREEHPFWLDS